MNVTIIGNSTSIASGHFAIVGSNNQPIASIRAIETSAKRDASYRYDAHRMAKGDLFNTSVEYIVEGDIEAVCRAIAAKLPACFKDAKFGTSWFKEDAADFYACYNFLRTLAAQGGWYGNTAPATVKKIKATWKKGFSLEI